MMREGNFMSDFVWQQCRSSEGLLQNGMLRFFARGRQLPHLKLQRRRSGDDLHDVRLSRRSLPPVSCLRAVAWTGARRP
jgi:hypothetical protein